jgi:hypothetical protein
MRGGCVWVALGREKGECLLTFNTVESEKQGDEQHNILILLELYSPILKPHMKIEQKTPQPSYSDSEQLKFRESSPQNTYFQPPKIKSSPSHY